MFAIEAIFLSSTLQQKITPEKYHEKLALVTLVQKDNIIRVTNKQRCLFSLGYKATCYY